MTTHLDTLPVATDIPTIDFSLVGDPVARDVVLEKLRHALTDVGFLYLANHGSPHFLGYSSVGSEMTAGRTDAREQFEFATELAPIWHPGLPLYEHLVGPNQVRFREPLLNPPIGREGPRVAYIILCFLYLSPVVWLTL
jgi:isopenicillin N synthase-like dioxygenase